MDTKTVSDYLKQSAARRIISYITGKPALREEGAKFANKSDINQYLSSNNKGLLINGKDLRLSESVSFQSVAVYGVTGKGKSTALVRPSIFDKANTDSVLIVNDMKGSLFETTSGYMKKKGYRVIVFNPNDLEHSSRLNPFEGLSDRESIMRLSLLLSSGGGDTGDNDDFWKSGGERYIRFFMKCLQRMPKSFNTPHNLYHLLQNFGTDGEELNEFVEAAIGDDIFLQNDWKSLIQGADETITSFIINALVSLKIFSEPHVCALTASSDFDLSTIRKQKTIIYMITPPQDQDIYSPLISMYFLSFIHACMKPLKAGDLPVYFLYDEFGNSYLPGFDKIITTTREYKISFMLLMQGQNQIVTRYGKNMLGNINSGIATHISFGGAEELTAQFFERRAGKVRTFYRQDGKDFHVEHFKERTLLDASEIRELPDNQLLIISDNRKTTVLEVHPSHLNLRFRMMMKLPPAQLSRKNNDVLTFIPI